MTVERCEFCETRSAEINDSTCEVWAALLYRYPKRAREVKNMKNIFFHNATHFSMLTNILNQVNEESSNGRLTKHAVSWMQTGSFKEN